MELNQLHYFMTVAKTENITKAAQQLYITQPALSRVILRLETELGTKLFDRNGGRLTLNSKGTLFLKYVTTAIDAIDTGVHMITADLESRKIYICNYLTIDLFKPIVERCQAEFPNVAIEVVAMQTSESCDSAMRHEPDIVMSPTDSLKSYLFTKTFTEKWCVIYNKKYPFKNKLSGSLITLKQLAEEPIAFCGSKFDREFIDGIFKEAGLSPILNCVHSLNESAMMINRCKSIGIVPVSNYRNLISNVDQIPINALLIADNPCERSVYLGRYCRFLTNSDDYKILETIENHVAAEMEATAHFFEETFDSDLAEAL